MKIKSLLVYITIILFLLSCSNKNKVLTVSSNYISNDSIIVKKDKVNKEKINDDYYKENFFRYEDYIYKNNIKTILFHKKGWELSSPVIELNSDEKLKLSFDDFDADVKNYKFTIIHCNAFWQPSDIEKNRYIERFTEDFINDYKMSFNTIQNYTHYNLIFPSEDFIITKSGNYILKIFIDEDEDNVIFTRRFMVFESKVNVTGIVKRATNIDDMNYKQEIDFKVNYSGYDITNPYQNVKVVLRQNCRWDNAITDIKPKMIKNDELIYDYEIENVFSGGNEFRRFDTKSLRYNSERIMKFGYDSLGHHVYLLYDERRPFITYASIQDINGKKIIKTTDNSIDSDVEAEYAHVHFTLPYKSPLIDGSIYVMGALSDWGFNEECKMKYNYKKFAYETSIYLKQGYYNYQYVFLENGKNIGDESFIEGKHYETENDYTIYVYNQEFGVDLYDRLIAVKILNSLRRD